jgi:subtilisin family serine protease
MLMPQRRKLFPVTSARSRTALAASVAAALAVTTAAIGASPVFADEDSPARAAYKPLGEKFSTHDATLLAEARAGGEPYVTMMIAAEPGETGAVADRIGSLDGASVGYTEDSVGYVRATVRTGKADAAIAEATGMDAVHAIDLNEEIELPDPSPESVGGARATADRSYPGPGPGTPAANPYQPAHETGAVDFVEDHPEADGRGVTIGVLDTGVDLAHPALQETTTGERKITDWVTATDPIVDGDATWRPMITERSGASFQYNGRQYTAPAGDHLVSTFRENATNGSEMAGDVDRDGTTTGSWAVLYDAEAGTVRVDLDDDADFTDNAPMTPYGAGHDVGYFGTDDPATEIAEAIPFVVEIREDVPMDPYGGDWVGQRADFVNIGIVSDAHGTHVAGITAANGLFGGEMNGAAPGAQVVSSRACSFTGGCTYTALTEGMIDLVVNRDVDVVNMSIGGLPALNDGNNARAALYNELIDTYGVQMFISAGNDGPGTNTVGDPSVADRVVSVGAAVSRETWAANYGSGVERRYALFPFSAAGPRDDGGFKPTLAAPGASVNAIPTWLPGSPVEEAGYQLPPGYGMFNGTSMASPQATGAAALLLSAAGQYGVEAGPDALRTALISSAEPIRGVQAHEQGAGLIDTQAAWRLLTRGASSHAYAVEAPVDHTMAGYLATPGVGTGVYDRESAPAVGESERYEVTITRTTGPDRAIRHSLKLVNNHDNTFRLVGAGRGDSAVTLPLGEPVTVTIEAAPQALGAHSAILAVDDPGTVGTDTHVLATVVVPQALDGPTFAAEGSGTAQRNDTTSYFVRVPEGAETLEVAMSGLEGQSQTRWIAYTPWGTPAEDTASNQCYPHYDPEHNTCPPDVRSYEDPLPGVWEIEVESRRTSPMLDNPFTVTGTALGTTFDPETVVIDEAQTATPSPVSWQVTNGFAPIEGGSLAAGELGSAMTDRPSIAEGEYATTTVAVPEGASEFSAVIGGTSDPAADLDLYVYLGEGDGRELVGSSTTSASDETVTLPDPAAGTYTVEVHGYAVPAGSTEYDYRDTYLSAELGTVAVEERLIGLGTGETTEIGAQVTVTGSAPEGREFFGEVRLLNAAGSATGAGGIRIESVTP